MYWLFWRSYFYFDILKQNIKNIDMTNVENATIQLGKAYRGDYPDSKEDSRKLGIRKIYDQFNGEISKRQIKRFITLPTNRKGEVKIPYNSMRIFEKLVTLIDKRDDLRNACR